MDRKNFVDSTHGGRESALACAQAYRDHVITSMPPLLWREKMEIRTTNNTSGVVGVCLLRKKSVVHSWHAGIQIQGKKWQRSFSIRKHGYDNAREKAIQYRLKMLPSVEGEYVMHPVQKRPQLLPPTLARAAWEAQKEHTLLMAILACPPVGAFHVEGRQKPSDSIASVKRAYVFARGKSIRPSWR